MRPGLLLALCLSACQEPIGEPRQTLEGFRIAAVQLSATDEGWVPRAAVVVDGRLWSDDPVTLEWFWSDRTVAAAQEVLAHEEPLATGPRPTLTADPQRTRLVLRATAPSGEVQTAILDTDGRTGESPLHDVEVRAIAGQIRSVKPNDLTLEARDALLPSDETTQTEAGGFVRCSGSGTADLRMRWMATSGTWLELNDHQADWTPGKLRYDDTSIETARLGDEGVVSWIALGLDEQLGNGWRAGEIHVGEPGAGGWVEGRWLPGAPDPGRWWVRLAADDTSPIGLAVDDAWQDDRGSESIPPCVPGDAFDPNLLLEHVCTRQDVDGAVVIIDVTEAP